MEKLSVHQKGLKQANKAKKKPIKVVYISNPMRVKATASEFKGLVQELTGQDSDIADLSKFTDPEPTGEAAPERGSNSAEAATCGLGFGNGELHQQQQQQDPCSTGYPLNIGEVFAPQVLESLDAFMATSPGLLPVLTSRQ